MSKEVNQRVRILLEIADLWDLKPQMRLGQLLSNYGFKNDKAVFAMTDDELEHNLKLELSKNIAIKYPKPAWAVHQATRALSGVVEDICKHGIGHPNEQWLIENDPDKIFRCHGCDGCCGSLKSILNKKSDLNE